MLSVSILRDNLGKGSEMQYVKYAEHKEGPGNKEKPTSLQEALSLTGSLAQLWRPVFQSDKEVKPGLLTCGAVTAAARGGQSNLIPVRVRMLKTRRKPRRKVGFRKTSTHSPTPWAPSLGK